MITDKDLKKIIKNCDMRIREAKQQYKIAVKEHCVYSQKNALSTIDFNLDLKLKCLTKIKD